MIIIIADIINIRLLSSEKGKNYIYILFLGKNLVFISFILLINIIVLLLVVLSLSFIL